MNRRIKTIAKYVLPFWAVERLKFPVEARIAAGKQTKLPEAKSALLFTLNKCASTFTPAVMHYLNLRTRRLKELDFEGYYYNMGGKSFHERSKEDSARYFLPQGVLLAPLRRYYPAPNLDEFTKVLVLRDPRDLLTSKYFSQASTHSIPLDPEKRKIFLERRERVKNQRIDDFVFEWADRIKEDFREYLDMLDRHEVTFVRYEDIILDFENAIRRFASAFDYELSTDEVEELRRIGGYHKEQKENIHSHTRKRLPGDHKEKLKPETIAHLNQLFGEELSRFGYDV